MTKKTFDCIAMKREVVRRAQQQVTGMSTAEKIAYYQAVGNRERAAQQASRRHLHEELPQTGTDH